MDNIDISKRYEELFQILELKNDTNNSVIERAKQEAYKDLSRRLEEANGDWLIAMCLRFRRGEKA